jgi:hypothetical protein
MVIRAANVESGEESAQGRHDRSEGSGVAPAPNDVG